MAPRYEDDDEAFDATDDDGTPHIGEHDESILYAAQLDQLQKAGF